MILVPLHGYNRRQYQSTLCATERQLTPKPLAVASFAAVRLQLQVLIGSAVTERITAASQFLLAASSLLLFCCWSSCCICFGSSPSFVHQLMLFHLHHHSRCLQQDQYLQQHTATERLEEMHSSCFSRCNNTEVEQPLCQPSLLLTAKHSSWSGMYRSRCRPLSGANNHKGISACCASARCAAPPYLLAL